MQKRGRDDKVISFYFCVSLLWNLTHVTS